MSKPALFIRHVTCPGRRDEVEHVWREHMAPAVAANGGHEAYFYCFGADPDVICAFQQYASREAADAFLETPAYAAYIAEVSPLLAGEPEVQSLEVVWSKDRGMSAGARSE